MVGERLTGTAGQPRAALAVDVVSDVMCPWCYVGKRRLEQAVARSGIAVAVRWRPFQLDPTLPGTGKDRALYLAEKFGSAERARRLYAPIRAAGDEEGIGFDFEAIRVAPNTLDAHRLIRWALSGGVQDIVVEALFRAYFIEGRDIGDRAVLIDIAAAAGMDVALVAELLERGADIATIEQEIALARRMGVTGVPTFIVDNRYAVVGAQPAEQLIQAFAMVAAQRNANDNAGDR